MKKVLFIICVVLTGVTACDRQVEITAKSAFAMDTVATITVYGDSKIAQSAIDAALERLHELEEAFSYTDPHSQLSRINATAYEKPVEVGEDMGLLIQKGLYLSEFTDGAFDISLGKLIDLRSEQTPPQTQIDALLPNLGYENIIYKDGAVSFANSSVAIHFGGIAKGYAVDELIKVLTQNGVKSAVIDIGGEIGIIGKAPRKDGLWKIGIRDPNDVHKFGTNAAVLNLHKGKIATSGNYERPDHILDPATGFPSTGLASITVITDSATISDALSTALFVMSNRNDDFIRPTETEEGLYRIEDWKTRHAFIEELGGYCIVFIDQTGHITSAHSDDCDFCTGSHSFNNAYLD